MIFNIIDIDFNSNFDSDYFDSSKYLTEESTEENDEVTSKIEEEIYPMYVPTDTKLTSHDVVETEDGERVIMTFSGESSFILVEETCNSDTESNYIYGDPYLILDTVGAISDTSVTWISNGIEYSVMSDTMDIDELITVAQSINVKAVGK